MKFASFVSFAFALSPAATQASWSFVYTAPPSPLRSGPMFGVHEDTGQCLSLFGLQVVSQTYSSQVWRFQGSTWSLLTGPQPPVRIGAMLGYDAARQRLVLFGGLDVPGQGLDDTWLWNGSTWTNAPTLIRPPSRSNGAMAFDRGRGVLVLMGGRDANGLLGDVWEWNGTAWQASAAVMPNPRQSALLAFDPIGGGLLLYGGLTNGGSSGTLLGDTWTFTGTSWVQRQPTTPPPHRLAGGIATDLHRQRVVLFGGVSGDPFVWEWNGTQWNVVFQSAPTQRSRFGMGYDSNQRRIVVHGGAFAANPSYNLDDTWIYRTPLPADVVPFGAGCAGTAGTPALAAAPFTLPWLGDTMRTVVQTIPAGEPGAVFVSSFGSTPPIALGPVGMPGCYLLVPTDVAEFRLAVAGAAEWAVTIPNVPVLAGASFGQQAFVFDLAANPLGLTNSNAITATLGVR